MQYLRITGHARRSHLLVRRFLLAVHEADVKVSGIMGTSAGALVGSLYAAGYSPAQIAYEFSSKPPLDYLGVSPSLKDGVLTLR